MKAHDEYDQFVIDQYEEMTGCEWAEAEEDESGTYFSRGNWVSCKTIADALKAVADYYED
jgi:hypothetical protein